MIISRSVEIGRPPAEVRDYVLDASNDPQWCPKVISSSERPGEQGVYDVVHKPVPFMPKRRMVLRLVSADEEEIRWHEEDDSDSFRVTYRLQESEAGCTRFTQKSVAEVGVPRFLHPIWRWGIGRDMEAQLQQLRAILEHG